MGELVLQREYMKKLISVLKLAKPGLACRLLLLLSLCGCAYDGQVLRQTLSPSLKLTNDLDGMIARELLPYSETSIKVVSLKTGSTLYEKNPYLLMTPASVQKLFTAAAVLSYMGPDHRIETSIAVNAENDILHVSGCGDPLLKTTDLTAMANELSVKLTPGRNYNLAGSPACFDEKYWGSGWMWDDEPAPEAAFISPLSVNGNSIKVIASPGQTPSSALDVSTDPPTRYVFLENSAKTAMPGGSCSVSITRPAGDRRNHIRIEGSLAPECPPVWKRLTVWRPEMYTLTLLAEQLQKAGMETASLFLKAAPPDATPLVAIRRPVIEIISLMLKNSDNLSAEHMLRYLSHVKTGRKGTAAEGSELVKEYLRKNGILTDQLIIADGSGVSRYNLVNADTLTQLLVAVHNDQATLPFFAGSLPVAGIDGTLAGRMKGTPAEGKVRAKTGTMKGISALAGYTSTADGEPLAFAMIMQNFIGPAGRIRDLQDRIAVILSAFSVHTVIQDKQNTE